VTSPPATADYVARYGRFRPGYFFQDITLSPDLPSVAPAAAQVFADATGDRVDGVLTVDPYALAALLHFTGPVQVDGLAQPLTADDAAQILVRDQYTTFGTDAARTDMLDQASRKTFDQLVHGSLPAPAAVADVLGPVVEQQRLAFHPLAEDAGVQAKEQALVDALHVGGAVPATDGGDAVDVITQNNGNNKIDMFLHRTVAYDVQYDPGSGHVTSTLAVTLRNDAPVSGLPASVIGSNDQGLPPGTNRMWVSVYTPLDLREARLGGQVVPLEHEHELGRSVYSHYVDVPAGGSVELDLDLDGAVAPTSRW
jgi:hypothetical protein